MAEGARLESVFTFTGNVGSNPTLSAISLANRRRAGNQQAVSVQLFTTVSTQLTLDIPEWLAFLIRVPHISFFEMWVCAVCPMSLQDMGHPQSEIRSVFIKT